MFNDIIFRSDLQIDWFHKSAAAGSSVTRIYIDMHAVETFGTVICIAVTGDFAAAVSACEVFGCFLEFPAHEIQNNNFTYFSQLILFYFYDSNHITFIIHKLILHKRLHYFSGFSELFNGYSNGLKST